ncbi:hypothetical protein D3879_07045 [Pseudomonas cavernicola]|uniref:Uncharacterized protein n=1 Tax=Pseudomonas cavernicola TaxID=2320866 RepID=A0A418XKP9_9PSED|nr:hypothetical protein [Pseudomonas cavernicola]RJG13025.1 hypothetical protein D3879_07045 [Pseudomonas cavernicola]
MADSKPTVTPFPRRFESKGLPDSAVHQFQLTAEQRIAMRQRLFSILEETKARPTPSQESGQNSDEWFRQITALYRKTLAEGRQGDE